MQHRECASRPAFLPQNYCFPPWSNCRAVWLRSCHVRGKGFSRFQLHLAGHSYHFLPFITIRSLHLPWQGHTGSILFPSPVTIVSLCAAHAKETFPYIITLLSVHYVLSGWYTLCYAHWEICVSLLTTEKQISPNHNFQKALFHTRLE